MANADQPCPVAAVLGSQDLMPEILLRLGSSRDLLRCTAVSPHWLATTRTDAFRRLFSDRHRAAHVGFLVEMQEGEGRILKLMYAHENEDSAVAIRRRIQTAVLAGNNVLGSRDGVLLTHRVGEGYFTSSPTDIPRHYWFVAPTIPPIPRGTPQHTVNTYGQYGLVPNAGREGMGFFTKDPSRNFLTCYDGVSFLSSTDIFVHVCVWRGGLVTGWERSVSPPYQPTHGALFHRNPYCVLVGRKMYLMYVVGFVVSFDVITCQFRKIELPPPVLETCRSWYEYTVASHSGGGLVLVQYHRGCLHRWVLSFIDDAVNWTHEGIVHLRPAFGDRISPYAWQQLLAREAFPLGADHFFSIQVRIASTDGRFVLLTLGFALAMYEVDMINHTVREITNTARTGMLGRMHQLSEPWPANMIF